MREKSFFINLMAFFVVAIMIVEAIFYVLRPFSETGMIAFTDIVSVLVAATATAAIGFLYVSMRRNPSGRVWKFFTLFMGSWLLAEIIWAVYEVVLGVQVPFPSPADGFWLLGYVFAIYGGAVFLKTYFVKFDRAKAVLVAVAAAIALLVLWWFVISSIVSSDQTLLEKIIGIAYPVLDVFIAAAIAYIILNIPQAGEYTRALFVGGIGFLLFAVSDAMFALLVAESAYQWGNLSDSLYTLAYVFVVLGALLMYRSVSKIHFVTGKFGKSFETLKGKAK